jgi:asparagine synthase (glutamine-hydrolysing)
MATSLEVRAPWLDPRIIELAYAVVSDSLRNADGRKKILPRRLAARLLPKGLDVSRKQGFSIPLADWFKGSFGGFVEDTLGSAAPGVFDPQFLRRLVRAQRRGFINADRLFALVMFELWRRTFGVSL